jgi:SanA protein
MQEKNTEEINDLQANKPEKMKSRFISQPFKIFLVCSLICVLILVAPFLYIFATYNSHSSKQNNNYENYTGIILGAQVRGSYPSTVLQRRLDKGAEAYKQKKVNKLLLSGSNESKYYNEPLAMQKYLMANHNIPIEDLVLDFAGLRTLDSCYRAKNTFKVKYLAIITQDFHLARAYYLCSQYNFDDIKTIAAEDSSVQVAISGYVREIPASINAIWDIFTKNEAKYGSDGSELEI